MARFVTSVRLRVIQAYRNERVAYRRIALCVATLAALVGGHGLPVIAHAGMVARKAGPVVPSGYRSSGPVRLCSMYVQSINDFLVNGWGYRQSVPGVPPDSSTYLMGEEYVFYTVGHKASYIYLWQQIGHTWTLWARARESGSIGFVTAGLSGVFYNLGMDSDLHFYRADDPPQDCGTRFVVVVTRDNGAVLGQVPFTIIC